MGFIIAYVVLCLLVGWAADSTTLGFGGGFLLSLLLSPLVGFIIYCFYPNRDHIDRNQQLMEQQVMNQQLIQQQLIQQNQKQAEPTVNLEVELEKLKIVRDKNLITEPEYNSMRQKLMDKYI